MEGKFLNYFYLFSADCPITAYPKRSNPISESEADSSVVSFLAAAASAGAAPPAAAAPAAGAATPDGTEAKRLIPSAMTSATDLPSSSEKTLSSLAASISAPTASRILETVSLLGAAPDWAARR